jgi:hypothetical protein
MAADNQCMETETETKAPVRLLSVFTPAREERMRARVPLTALSVETGIPLVYLSQYERGLRNLSPEDEARRRRALRRLVDGAGELG